MARGEPSSGGLDRSVRPSAAEVVSPGLSRGRALRRGTIAVTMLFAGDTILRELTAFGASAPSAGQDARILKFGLLLEDLQEAFYAAALDQASLTGELRDFARTVGSHERQHAAFIRDVLGPKAGRKPRFDFGAAVHSAKSFAATAVALEDLGVAAYNGQAPNLTPAALAAAGRLVSVEARHAAWIRDLVGRNPAPRAVDLPQAAAAVTAALNRTHFVKGR